MARRVTLINYNDVYNIESRTTEPAADQVAHLNPLTVFCGDVFSPPLDCDLDGRFATVRALESNLGNPVADIMDANTNGDCAIVNETSSLRNIHVEGGLKYTPTSIIELEMEFIGIAPVVEG